MTAKLPKIRMRDPVTGRPLGYTARPVRLAIDTDGKPHEIQNHTSSATMEPRVLPEGWRLATDGECETYHCLRVQGDEWQAQLEDKFEQAAEALGISLVMAGSDPYAEKRARAGERLDEFGRRIPKSPADRARDRKPGRKGTTW
jgi:hypothetical protein